MQTDGKPELSTPPPKKAQAGRTSRAIGKKKILCPPGGDSDRPHPIREIEPPPPGDLEVATIGEALLSLRAQLAGVSETPNLDAQVLVGHVMKRPRAWVLAHREVQLTSNQAEDLIQKAARLSAGEPLPYVLGAWEFYGMTFRLTPGVLIPRPETELLVDQALAWLQAHPHRRRTADVGTGSGCIAISLAKHIPDLDILASDISWEALRVASANAHVHQVSERIAFFQGDLLGAVRGPFDLICANLPYIPSESLPNLAVFGREPTLALDGGAGGLEYVRRLLSEADPVLARGGCLLVEIEASQGARARSLARRLYPAAQVELVADLAGRDRLLVIAKTTPRADV